jgi:hypothetical protein
MFHLHQAMHESILQRVASGKQAKEAWDILPISYQGMDKVKASKLQFFGRDFETMSMKDRDSLDSFYTHVIDMINQIKSHGENIEDRKVVEKLLRSLPPKYDPLVVTLEEDKDLSQFSLDEMQASLINHEHILNRSNMSLENEFFVQSSISSGRGMGRANSKGRGRSYARGGHSSSPVNIGGRGQNQNTSQPSSHRFDKSKIQCHYCKKYGHYAYECNNRQYNQNKQGQDHSNITNTPSSPMFMAHVEVMPIVSLVECNVSQ